MMFDVSIISLIDVSVFNNICLAAMYNYAYHILTSVPLFSGTYPKMGGHQNLHVYFTKG
jgi:hypothetical protein